MAVIAVENLWAIPFTIRGVRNSGGELRRTKFRVPSDVVAAVSEAASAT